MAGEWEELEKYLLGFTTVADNRFSIKIFFDIRKQKYLEALDRNDIASALEILRNDLKVFSAYDGGLYQELCQLMTLGNFRENESLSNYKDAQTSRRELALYLKKLIEANPLFGKKLIFPSFSSARLLSLVNQSLNMQHSYCECSRPIPVIEMLFTDHVREPLNVTASSPSAVVPSASVANLNAYPSRGVHGSFQTDGASISATNPLAGSTGNSAASLLEPAVATATSLPILSNRDSGLIRPPLPPASLKVADYPRSDHDRLMNRIQSAPFADEGPSCSAWVIPSTSRQHATPSLEGLPRKLACSLHQGSAVTCLDFHPTHHTLLLVGSANGEVTLWELRTQEKVVSKPFMVWDVGAHSLTLQAVFARKGHASVIRAIWSPDGGFIGVAFNKYLIHLYAYAGSYVLQQLLEVEAHNGPVNDMAFVRQEDQLCIATCGDDRLVKVWDLNGQNLFSFAGHQAPVYSICPHQKEDIQFILSTSIDGKIKSWLYDNLGSRIDVDAPGRCCTTLLYCDDRSRLFSCGTSIEGDSFLVEWDESEGTIKRIYDGLIKKLAGTVVHFDTTQNQFLAVGEDSQIKFWDMNNVNILTSTDAEGGLASQPRLRFNKEGNLLAVSTTDDGFKILATAASLISLRPVETSTAAIFRSSRRPTEFKASSSSAAVIENGMVPSVAEISRAWNCDLERNTPARDSSTPCGDEPMSSNIKESRTLDGVPEKTKPWQLSEITHPVQCQEVTMPQGNNAANKVLRLVYTHSGVGLCALGSDGILTVWKWQSDEQNPGGKATTRALPQQWKPNMPDTEHVMATEHAIGVRPSDRVPCLTLSRNDSYIVAAYGGLASLFNTQTFKEIAGIMPPPPTMTCVQFYPLDNNIIAIGFGDSTVSIYQVREDVEIAILKGHRRAITGLAFSTGLNILVSAGGDGVLCVWNTNIWVKLKSVAVNMLADASLGDETAVQFHPDHIHLLVTQQRLLAVYDASTMERISEWAPQRAFLEPITAATYSGDGQLVYASFLSGSVWVVEASTLGPRCHIASSAYNVVPRVNGGQAGYPLTIAAHPQERNQFAIGLTDGSVKVMEPLESEGEWGKSPPDNQIPSRYNSIFGQHNQGCT